MKNEEEEIYMLIKTYIHVLNLKKEDFVDVEGSKRESFKVNYSQSDGEVVGSLTVRKEKMCIRDRPNREPNKRSE